METYCRIINFVSLMANTDQSLLIGPACNDKQEKSVVNQT